MKVFGIKRQESCHSSIQRQGCGGSQDTPSEETRRRKLSRENERNQDGAPSSEWRIEDRSGEDPWGSRNLDICSSASADIDKNTF